MLGPTWQKSCSNEFFKWVVQPFIEHDKMMHYRIWKWGKIMTNKYCFVTIFMLFGMFALVSCKETTNDGLAQNEQSDSTTSDSATNVNLSNGSSDFELSTDSASELPTETNDTGDTETSTNHQGTDSDTFVTLTKVCSFPLNQPPGSSIEDKNYVGSGSCQSKSVADIVDEIAAKEIRLEGIPLKWAAEQGMDAEGVGVVHAFETVGGGFAFAIKIGWGDCMSGCINNQWYYFKTNQNCEPLLSGEFSAVYDGSENCFAITKEAKWGLPKARDPLNACNASLVPNNISGEYTIAAKGEQSPCGDKPVFQQLDVPITIVIAQNPADLSTGTVTVKGFEHHLLKDPLPATFVRDRFEVKVEYNNLPSNCPSEYLIDMVFDFECFAGLYLKLEEFGDCGDISCCESCKGFVELTFGQ